MPLLPSSHWGRGRFCGWSTSSCCSLRRAIQEHIKRPLAEELLFGKLANGGRVGVHVKDDAITFDIESKERNNAPELV